MKFWASCWVSLVLLATPGLARPLAFPYQEAGLSAQEAANHLLQRLSYGPTPGQVEAVARQGLESWFEEQLKLSEPPLPPGPGRDWQGLAQRKLERAVHSPAQLREVMAEFWFNHFNVSVTDPQAAPHVASYEEEAIRPHCLGRFQDLLEATARHPAMLYYLNNAQSVWEPPRYELPDRSQDPFGYHRPHRGPSMLARPADRGLNENYARELLELHTLGVNGGYRQQDVTELARILTGWTVEQNSFVFRPEWHDPEPKRFLYQQIQPAGMEEGLKVLEQLAQHPSTARFIARKMAVRFVSDRPPASLEQRLSRAFTRSRGETRALLEELLQSVEFWQRPAPGSKIKSPLELQASSLRILGARVEPQSELPGWLGKMGQELYACRPPTGWPDRPETWLTPGNLVQRLSFAHLLASQQLRGVKFQQLPPAPKRPPKTVAQALEHYAQWILPARDTSATVQLLKEAASDPSYSQTVIATSRSRGQKIPKPKAQKGFTFTPEAETNILGLLLGCPQFQRR